MATKLVAMPSTTVKAVKPVRPVKAVKAPAKPKAVPMPKPSPMARPPVARTQRAVPSVKTGRGVVRTDTHNAANNLPAAAKRKRRGI